MIGLILGGLVLLLLLGGLRAFERASVATVKSLLVWIAALAGLSLTALLVLSGRGPVAFFALSLLLPLLRERWAAWRAASARPAGRRPVSGSAMSRAEALEVLGLAPDAGEVEIQLAYVRLIRAAHPDNGGSDWLAARINQARDVLLKGSRSRTGGA